MSTDHPTGTSSSTLGNLQEQAGEKVSQLTEGVKDGVMRSEKSFRGNLSKQADDFANALRSAKSEVDPDSSVATMFDYAAENVGSIAQSLKSTDVTEMMESVRSFARTRPGAFLGIAALAGFATTRFLLASESGRSGSGSMSGSGGNYGSRNYSGSSYSGGSYSGSGSNYGARSTGTDAVRSGSTGMGASTGATGSSYGIGSNSPSGSGPAGSTPPGYGSSGSGIGSSGTGSTTGGTASSTGANPASTGTGSSMGRDTLSSSQGSSKPGQGGSNV